MSINPQGNVESFSARYDQQYYRSHCGPIPYERSDFWLQFFHTAADHIVRALKPRRLLDAGCALGFLVEALWERGVQAYGIDVSEYAIGQVRRDIQPYCRCASLAEPIEGRFDLVTCIEVLEHIPAEEEDAVLRNLTGVTDCILFSSTPTDLTEPTHVNVQPTITWLHHFADHGFAPDLLFDASFIAPHAFLLRRVEQRPPEEVLVLFSELIRYRLTLADRHRQLDHLHNEVARLQSATDAATGDAASLHQQLEHFRAEHSRQEQGLESQAAEIAHLVQHLSDREAEFANQKKEWEAASQSAAAQQEADARAAEAASANREVQRERDASDREIRGMIATLTNYSDSLRMSEERLSLRLGAMESKVADVAHQTTQILQSRIWRTLCAAGGMVLSPLSIFRSSPPASRTAPAAQPPAGTPALAPGKDFYSLVCDEPRQGDDGPRTGMIAVSGWALAKSGIDNLEVRLAGVTVKARTGSVRPDVARCYPDVSDARTSGFTTEIDSRSVSNGLHILSVIASSVSGATCEVQVPIRIDHDAGYASDYDRWIAQFENRNESLIQLKLRVLLEKPLISILVPVYRTPLDVLRRTVESVMGQSYSNWQLCLADDCSQSPAIQKLLDEYAARDGRIKVNCLTAQKGISHASNAALELATGEFVALLDHDDELSVDALYRVVEAINLQSDADLLYSDEDKIDVNGRRYDPFFKPNWSPDLLLSENYLCHLLVVRRSLLTQVGGFRSAFDGSQDYDLVLRLSSATSKIVHIPHVLYHWRSLPTSTASVSSQKEYAVSAAERAIQEALDRSSPAAKVVPGAIPGRWRVRYPLAADARVSIIIASGGKVEVLRANLENLFAKTGYRNYEVVVIDNSRQSEIQRLVGNWPNQPQLRYLDWRNKPFNYSAINNEAARHCESPLLLFLNDDTTVIAPGWLEAMAELAIRPEVGAVGARLLYPDGRIQHAGVVMGLFDNCGHAFKGLPGDRQHYFDLPDVIRNVSAVTGACLMTRAAVFQEVGGFDEQAFAVAFNDIDLCLKIGQRGYRVLYTPHALLHHHEAFSKTAEDLVPHPAEVRAMQTKWKDLIAADPFYSPNLTRTAEDYSLRRKG